MAKITMRELDQLLQHPCFVGMEVRPEGELIAPWWKGSKLLVDVSLEACYYFLAGWLSCALENMQS